MPKATVAKRSMTALAPTSVRERRIRSGTSGAGTARLDQRERAEERRRAREEEQRLRRGPAGVGSLDDGVDEQGERAGDGQSPGRVVAPPRHRGAALGEQKRAERERERGRPGC